MMNRVTVIVLACLFCDLASAEPAGACLIEVSVTSRVACLRHAADTRLAAVETRLATVATSLQGARAAAIVGFEGGLMANQRSWRRKAEKTCRKQTDRVEQQLCRLRQIEARELTLERTLAEAFAPIGGLQSPLGLGTDGVEIFVPLDPTGRPRPFITLDTPLTPGG
ncbi:MAG: hypothetical protein AAF317_08140 [Pseudomonadota bacterium]